jgi:hypothetical protein
MADALSASTDLVDQEVARAVVGGDNPCQPRPIMTMTGNIPHYRHRSHRRGGQFFHDRTSNGPAAHRQ